MKTLKEKVITTLDIWGLYKEHKEVVNHKTHRVFAEWKTILGIRFGRRNKIELSPSSAIARFLLTNIDPIFKLKEGTETQFKDDIGHKIAVTVSRKSKDGELTAEAKIQ